MSTNLLRPSGEALLTLAAMSTNTEPGDGLTPGSLTAGGVTMPRKRWKRAVSMLTAACLLLLPLHEAMAHGGGTDRYGCHRDSRTNTRHCHEKEEDVNWLLVGGVLGGLVVLGLAAQWLKDDDTSSTVQLVPHFDEENGLSLGAEIALDRMQRLGVRSTTGMAEKERDNAYVGAYWRLNF